MTLHTEFHTSPNISKALPCTLTHCVADSTDCATTIPPPASVPPHVPCLFVCLFVYLCHWCVAFFVCLFPLPVVSGIDRQKDGSLCLVQDYWKLNEITIKN